MLVTISAEVSYATGGHSGWLVTITAEVSYAGSRLGGWSPSLLMFYMPLEVFQEG